ncbi:MAG: hypothetical protein Q9192_005939, partial [Flavoplaca navasiana]
NTARESDKDFQLQHELSSRPFSQSIYKPPFPSTSFANKTIPFAGANTGLGKEAAINFVRLGGTKVILAIHPHPENEPQGEVAKSTIKAATGVTGVSEVYDLDYPSYASVLAFAGRVEKKFQRLHVGVLNAGIATEKFKIMRFVLRLTL